MSKLLSVLMCVSSLTATHAWPSKTAHEANDPCNGVRCARGSSCKVYEPTREAFCEPSCDLDNGGCRDDQWCELIPVQCIRAPCPPVVKCFDKDSDPCIGVFCPRGSSCKVYEPTEEAFCEPSCDLDNGGCRDDQSCELIPVQCIRAPCPPVVKCFDKASDPCIGVFCPRGSSCKVYEPTGEAFCEPSCDLDNGGCRDDQWCELIPVQCIRAPCPPVVKCFDTFDYYYYGPSNLAKVRQGKAKAQAPRPGPGLHTGLNTHQHPHPQDSRGPENEIVIAKN